MKIGGSLVRNARFSALTCLVSSLWFSCGIAVSMGGAGKHLLFQRFQAASLMSFCVAGVTLCDIPTVCITCRTCQNLRKSRTTFFTLHSTLHAPHSTLHTPHFRLNALYTLHSSLHTSPATLHTPHLGTGGLALC